MTAKRRGPLQDDAFIVRFGLMNVSHLRGALERCKVTRGFYGLSFFGENGLTLDHIAAAAAAPHTWMRVTQYGALRQAGYRLRREGPDNHLVLRFDFQPSDDELEHIASLFDAPQRNPHAL